MIGSCALRITKKYTTQNPPRAKLRIQKSCVRRIDAGGGTFATTGAAFGLDRVGRAGASRRTEVSGRAGASRRIGVTRPTTPEFSGVVGPVGFGSVTIG